MGQGEMKQCSCYDEDCLTIDDPLNCWIGKPERFAMDVLLYFPALPIADGFCPLVKETNENLKREIVWLE